MKVLASKEVEECLDGVVIKELRLDQPVCEKFIRHLALLGTLDYFPKLPRPFYRIKKKSQFILKGVQGNTTFQVFYINYTSEIELEICEHIATFR